MADIIVVSFKEETKAIKALHKIKELDIYGDITLYEYMMIRKKNDNEYDILQDDTSDEIWRTLTGAAVGGLVGALAGPVGLVIGLYSGGVIGAVADIAHYDFDDDFVKKINNKMDPGTTAIVAEVKEDSTVFIDEYLKPFNVEIIRTDADLEYDDFIDEHIEELEDKIESERKKLKNATTEETTKIKAKIADLKKKRKAKLAVLEAKRKSRVQEIKNKTEARLAKLKSRLNLIENKVETTITKARTSRMRKKIKKQEARLNKLQHQLEDILD